MLLVEVRSLRGRVWCPRFAAMETSGCLPGPSLVIDCDKAAVPEFHRLARCVVGDVGVPVASQLAPLLHPAPRDSPLPACVFPARSGASPNKQPDINTRGLDGAPLACVKASVAPELVQSSEQGRRFHSAGEESLTRLLQIRESDQ